MPKMTKSWVESANSTDTDFPLQNLPYGVFSTAGTAPRCGCAMGDQVLDLAALESAGLVRPNAKGAVFQEPAINAFMALGPAAWDATRRRVTELLAEGGDAVLKNDAALRQRALVPMSAATLHLPFQVSEFTDFYAGRHHASNVGTMLRGPENALPPNWFHIPIGYNGRASTVVVSGTPIRRPLGQMKPANAPKPLFGPSRRLDIELEMGAVVGQPSTMGEPVSVAQAEDMIFGYVLLNDWSARDIQAWEYVPLGPFQAKVFATTISPWVVTKAALEPFRVATPERVEELFPYLREPKPMLYDIHLDVWMQPEGAPRATRISETNYRYLDYSAAQQLAHHAIGGCKMNVGDLLGSGTISGPDRSQFGSLLELSWGGTNPVVLEGGETRSFLEDGDTMILKGYAQGEGYRIGFGECAGKILPAPPVPK